VPQGRDRRLVEEDEGCLSLPGAYMATSRPDLAVCHGQDQYGASAQVVGTGVLARCLQHETDHLEGRVFGDRLSRWARKELLAQHDRVVGTYPDNWPVVPRIA
jgi:peptide deformylase